MGFVVQSIYRKNNEREAMTAKPTIYFDLDGTLYDLYGRPNWLEEITTLKDPSAYADEDTALVDMVRLNEVLYSLIAQGYSVGIVSWLSKGATKEYDNAVRAVKKVWIKKYMPLASEIHIVKYGTPKHLIVSDKNSILVDDNAEVRDSWSRGMTIDATKDIIAELERLV